MCVFAHDIWDILGSSSQPAWLGLGKTLDQPVSLPVSPGVWQLPMNRTYLGSRGLGRSWARELCAGASRWLGQPSCFDTDEPDILGLRCLLEPNRPVDLFITIDRTYLAFPSALSGRSTLAILETYDVCVHHDQPSIFGACTHDVPDILLPMNRTYLGRALTMYRTYHYR